MSDQQPNVLNYGRSCTIYDTVLAMDRTYGHKRAMLLDINFVEYVPIFQKIVLNVLPF